MSKTCFQNAQKCVFLGVILQNFPRGMSPDAPRMVVPSALPLKLICDVTRFWRNLAPLGNFLRRLRHWLSPPQRNFRRQCLGVRGCYDVQLGRFWETKDTKKRVKLALIIYRDFMQKFLSEFERRGNINRNQPGTLTFLMQSNGISFLCAKDFWRRWLK